MLNHGLYLLVAEFSQIFCTAVYPRKFSQKTLVSKANHEDKKLFKNYQNFQYKKNATKFCRFLIRKVFECERDITSISPIANSKLFGLCKKKGKLEESSEVVAAVV